MTDGAIALIQPFITGQTGSNPAYRGVDKPLSTVTTHKGISVTTPLLVKYYGNENGAEDINKPLPTVTTRDRFGLCNAEARPFIVQNRIRPDGDRVYKIEKPLNTITGHGAGALVNPILVEVNHDGERSSKSIDKPLGAITSKRGKAVVSAFILQVNHDLNRSVNDPIPTIVTKQNTGVVEAEALVIPVLEKATENMDPRRLVVIDGELYSLDLRFRMLNNLELARAMGFTDNETTYEFAGNSGEVTKQIGNAVPVNLAAALVGAVLG